MDEKKIEELKKKVMTSLDTDAMSVSSKRLMANFIDLVLITCTLSILLMIPGMLLPVIVTKLLSALFSLIAGVIVLIKDGPLPIEPLGGQSIGKKTMHIKVTKADGKTPISFAESVQRNMLLAVPYFLTAALAFLTLVPIFTPYFLFVLLGVVLTVSTGIYAFEIFTLFRDLEGRRWGDQKAGTMVILE